MKKIILFVMILSWAVCAQAGTEYFPECEFSCYFPGVPDSKNTYVGNITIVQKQFYPTDFTLLKAECIPYSTSSEGELANLLRTQANMSNIKMPTISTDKENNLKVGTYSGNVGAAGYNLKLHGKLIVGQRSTLHLIVIEDINKFPSKFAVNFFDSYRSN
jgi:hypothetical protein